MKAKQATPLLALEKGQLWKTKTGHIEIMDVGRLLAHYRFYNGDQKRVAKKMERVRIIQNYLQANGGKLVKNERPEKA